MWDRYTIRRKINSFSRRAGWTWAPALPIRAWIDTTWRCNLHCRTCGAHRPGYNGDGKFEDMKPDVYERVRRELLPGLQEVYLSAGGEPFLAPIFYRMLDDMLAADKQICFVTNGTILRVDYLERVVRSPARIVVSLDGTTAEVMEYIRLGVKFDRVLEFLKTIKEMSDRFGHPRFRLEINYVVTRSNVEQLPDCIELAHRYGADKVVFNSFFDEGRTDEFAVEESLTNHPEVVMPHWEKARQRGEELGIVVPPIFFECRGRAEEERHVHQPTVYDNGRIRQCPLPWWTTYIESDGTVRPCCVFPMQTTMGSLLEQPFREIWNGPKYRALRRTVNTPAMPDPCRRCFLHVRL